LHVVNQYLQAATDTTVIEVVTEAANLQRLATAFVLTRVDARIKTFH
jgi:hypothetical protein